MKAFLTRSADIMRHLKDTKRPVVLTVNGRAEAVVQDAEAYRRLLDPAASASAEEGIRRGLQDLQAGRSQPAEEVFDALRAELAIPR
jgi:prevent-host-death family protein